MVREGFVKRENDEILKNKVIDIMGDIKNVLDSTLMKRLFRFDSGCLKCKVTSIFTILPLAITDDWNCLEVDLKKQLRRFYGTDFVEIIRVEVHGSCRLRRIYASYDSLADLQIPIDSRILQ
ncbi:cilia- and flagella-associated protein 20 isoform X4 [Halyomorpha halys]|uniref:cilia- and flagella-associated protein 20 isoform X4 n=1 Tax=Halyomorpha halys TaxID=286706 RepID=UPI0006D4F7C8|nr:cilia- and flagella-associated protein 20-like isoform X2 [Halyomorpha halys]